MARGALVWLMAAGCGCSYTAAQGTINGQITGHQHSQTPSSCLLPQLATPGSGGGGDLVVENDQSVQTSVETVSTAGVAGHTTYRVTIHLADTALNCYSIYGSSQPLQVPAAYQEGSPFGANLCGVNPQFFEYRPTSQFDSWLTVGITEGDSTNKVSSIGINFESWTETMPLVTDADTGGAVFWMNPDEATEAVSPPTPMSNGRRTMVVAQLTLPTVQPYSEYFHFDAQGRSAGHQGGNINSAGVVVTPASGPADWEENCIEVMVGGPQNGEGSHSVLNDRAAPMVPNGPCVTLTNPTGGVWTYDRVDFATGTRATLSCEQGFTQLQSSDMQKSCLNGQWTGGQTAQCFPDLPCPAIDTVGINGYYSYQINQIPHAAGSTATLHCNSGYSASTINTVKRCYGTFVSDSQPFATCLPAAGCPSLQSTVGGVWTYDTTDIVPNTRATLSCQQGYAPRSGADMHKVCGQNNQWTGGQSAQCVGCPRLQTPFGVWTYDTTDIVPNTRATLSCQSGYAPRLGEDMHKVCGQNNQWTGGQSAQCLRNQPCHSLRDAGTNGRYRYSSVPDPHAVGSTATFTCNAGYYASTTNTVKRCESVDGFFETDQTHQEPFATCLPAAGCPPLQTPFGGVWTYDTTDMVPNTRATLSCHQGYAPRSGADMHKVCGQNNQWTGGQSAQCLMNQPCHSLDDAGTNGRYRYSSVPDPHAVGSTATFTCNAGYHASTTNTVKRCESVDGFFETDQTHQEPFATCLPLDQRQHGGPTDPINGQKQPDDGWSPVTVLFLIALLAGGAYMAWTKQDAIQNFVADIRAKPSTKVGLTPGDGSATIYDNQTDESL